MYIAKVQDNYILSEEKQPGAIAELLPPVIVENETEQAPGERFGYHDQFEDLGNGLYYVQRKVWNRCGQRLRIQMITQARTCYAPERYLFPCVSYNGNQWGGRNSPKGLEKDGQPWVFAYDRMGIPSCTLTENDDTGFALFAADDSRDSLRTSASLLRVGEEYLHRIHYPVIEAPVSYSGKNKMTARYDEYLEFAPGAQITVAFYLFACQPEWAHFACAALLDRMKDAFPYRHQPVFTPDRVWELGIAYLERLVHNYQGRTLIIAGIDTKLSHLQAGHLGAKLTREDMLELMGKPEYNTFGFNREIYEIGWAGQGFLSTRMLMTDALEHGNNAKVELLIQSLENWVEKQRENGMVLPHFERYEAYDEAISHGLGEKLNDPCLGWVPDVCNLGWGASEMSKIYTLLKRHGHVYPEFLRFAVRICDFFAAHFSTQTGFGKLWTLDGRAEDGTGTVGGFMLLALLDVYRVTHNAAYIDCARRASDFYYTRDLDQFVCTAGAIDCQSIDKETAYPFVVSSLDLYELTGEKLYLERARKAAYYFSSWMFHYDALYPDTSDFSRYGYHTAGGTAISAEHHAIDPWGALLCAEYVRLARFTQDDRWLTRARMMWNNSLYGITANEGDRVHGLARPLGSQNEGFFQARWTKYRPDCEERGHFNDWLVSWVSCWRLTTLDRLKEMDGEAAWQWFA